MSDDVKQYDGSEKGINFVKKIGNIDPCDDDPDVLRAELSCGHITGPQTLTDYCRYQLEDGKPELRCPECKEQWSYNEVCKLAKLTAEEKEYFEEKLANNATKKKTEIKNCPGCKWLIARSDMSNLCVECTVCSENNGKTFQFCWQCQREWKGPGPRSDRCDNEGCSNKELDTLRGCSTIILKDAANIKCPSVRACITCGLMISHNTDYCKSVTCTRCDTVFCFVCLKLKSECGKTRGYYELCLDGVAPPQTSITFWRDN